MSLTAYSRKKLGDHLIGKAAFTMPTTVYLGLLLSDPGDLGSIVSELTGTGYARQPITAAMGAFDSTTGIAVNTLEVNFGTPGSDWGMPTWAVVMDALALGTGNMLIKEEIPSPRLILSGTRAVRFAIGQTTLRFI